MQVIEKAIKFKQISDLIEGRIGIATQRQASGMLAEVVMFQSKGDLATYLETLKQAHETDAIWQDLIDALTIGETYFLRDKAHFQLLREHILPDLIEKHRNTRTLNIWSVGCASGEEPYSLAITLYEILPDLDSWKINLVGTDLNGNNLRTARQGVFRKWAFRHTDADFQERYFDAAPNGLKIKPHIQQMVQFHHANLIEQKPSLPYDLILCRNVLLYFGPKAHQHVETILVDAIASGGWLLLGHAEMIRYTTAKWIDHTFPGSPIYQRPDATVTSTSRMVNYKHKTLTMEVVALPAEAQQPAQHRITYEDAVTQLQQENYTEAEDLIKQILDDHPDHAAAHTLMACIYANRTDLENAQTQIDAALYLNPLLADAYYLQAMLHVEQDQREDAHKALTSALYCQRNHPLASFMLGNLYAREGELMRAHRCWENTQKAIQSLKADSPVSDISPVTVGQLHHLVEEQLRGWA